MSQHYNNCQIVDQTFPAIRADMNNAFAALLSNCSGSTAPTSPVANQWWFDNGTSSLWIRNQANSAWVKIGTLDVTNLGLATLASPTFTGTPASVTGATNTSSTQIATQAFVMNSLWAMAPTWTSPTLLNGWTQQASPNAVTAYRKWYNQFVEVKCAVQQTFVWGTESIIFQLPSGYRPSETRLFPITIFLFSQPALCRVTSTGNVSIITYNGTYFATSATYYVYLEIKFIPD